MHTHTDLDCTVVLVLITMLFFTGGDLQIHRLVTQRLARTVLLFQRPAASTATPSHALSQLHVHQCGDQHDTKSLPFHASACRARPLAVAREKGRVYTGGVGVDCVGGGCGRCCHYHVLHLLCNVQGKLGLGRCLHRPRVT